MTISQATSTFATLNIRDRYEPDLAWNGQWSVNIDLPDDLFLNTYQLEGDGTDRIVNTITHELGHAVGLGHSYTGNVLYPYQTSQTTLGTQDLFDFEYLWP